MGSNKPIKHTGYALVKKDNKNVALTDSWIIRSIGDDVLLSNQLGIFLYKKDALSILKKLSDKRFWQIKKVYFNI